MLLLPNIPDDQISQRARLAPRAAAISTQNNRWEHGRLRAEMHLSHGGHISKLRPGQADAPQRVDEG